MLFKSIKGIHIDGHKSMSTNKPVSEYLNPEYVYIPLVSGANKLKANVVAGDHVYVGKIVATSEGRFYIPVASSVSGEVTGIKKMWHSSGRMVETLEIKNDFKDEVDPAINKEENPEKLTREEIIAKIKACGVIGLGGAGFPTYVKYQCDQKEVLIINGVECEPYLTCDYVNMLNNPEKLFKGVKYLLKAAGAQKAVIALKEYRHDLVELFQPYLNENPEISLYLAKDVYPAGWEKYLVQKITGKTYEKLPSEVGAVVNNSSTAILVADVIEKSLPQTERIVTITGDGISTPQNFKVKIGTRVKELVAKAGGYTSESDKTYCVAGGPMTGHSILIDDLIVDATMCAVVYIISDNDRLNPACLGCGKCSENCPAYLTPTSIRDAVIRKDVDAVSALNINACILCGLCSYVCPSRVEITDYMVQAKDLVRKAGK